LNGEIYINHPIKFRIIDDGIFEALDSDMARYLIILARDLNYSLSISRKFPRDRKIFIFGETPDNKTIRKLSKESIYVLTPPYLEVMAKDIGFNRPL